MLMLERPKMRTRSFEELVEEQKLAKLKKQREQERIRAKKRYEEQREQEQIRAKIFYEEQRERERSRAKQFFEEREEQERSRAEAMLKEREEQRLKKIRNFALLETAKPETEHVRQICKPPIIQNRDQDQTAVEPQKVKVTEKDIPVLGYKLAVAQPKDSEVTTTTLEQKPTDLGKASKKSDGTAAAQLISVSEETVGTNVCKIECKTFLSSLIQSLLSCFCLDSKLDTLPKLIERKLSNVLDRKDMYRRLQTYQDLKQYASEVEAKLDEQLESVAIVFPTTELFQENVGRTVPSVMDNYCNNIIEKSWPKATKQKQTRLQDLQEFTDCTVSVIIDLAILLFILKQKERELLKRYQTKPLKSSVETGESRGCQPKQKVRFYSLRAV